MLYFDYAAGAPLVPGVLERMTKALEEDFANAQASHRLGRNIHRRLEECREEILENLYGGAPQGEFLFTSGATESNNQLVKTLTFPISEIWYHEGDHPSLVRAAVSRSLQKKIPLFPIPFEKKTGETAWPLFLEKLKGRKRPLILLTHVHNQTGMITSLAPWGKALREIVPKAFIHSDMAQSCGKFSLKEDLPFLDSLTVSSHKMGGPKGVGGLFIKNLETLGLQEKALFSGGGQEFGRRSSTSPFPLILGLNEAFRFWKANGNKEMSRLFSLSRKLRKGLLSLDPRIEFPFPEEKAGPLILGCFLRGIPSDLVLRFLEEKGVYISSSSACSSKSREDYKALSLLGHDLSQQKSFLRISLGHQTSEKHSDGLLNIFRDVLKEILAFSCLS